MTREPLPGRGPNLVSDEQAMERLLAALADSPRAGVDIEANSFHAYYEKVCLIQVSTEDADWIVDPLAVDARSLGPIFADRHREVIFHAGEFDVLSLKRDYGFEFRSLFDTQLSAMLLGMGQVAYAKLVEHFFGVALRKGQQRSDWGRRPLNPRQLEYAAADVTYLLPLRDRLGELLGERGRAVEARAAFERLGASTPRAKVFDPAGYRKIKGYRSLDKVAMAVARALYLAREKRAQELDRPPFRIFGNDVLLELASKRPVDERGLEKVKGIPSATLQRSAALLLRAIQGGVDDPSAEPPANGAGSRGRREGQELTPTAEKRFQRLRAWRNRRAEERGIEGQVIARNEVLRSIARDAPADLEELRALLGHDSYVVQSYGDEILAALGQTS